MRSCSRALTQTQNEVNSPVSQHNHQLHLTLHQAPGHETPPINHGTCICSAASCQFATVPAMDPVKVGLGLHYGAQCTPLLHRCE
ncbi:hypothetical protein KC19_2G114700 [Ceratodon purpureus]|uniref:Uncharacterized protein n=1 Tax=Ceratodon purpureus TaxID=3225 RepID=A0A8T0IUE0_CERPU|nr:hypothetical protein KC19_2G114700 [Ceratodon purpureus]